MTLTQDTVEVETVTQFFSLKIVGVVSRPSPEAGGERLQTEWIVWVGDELKDGNYKAYRTLIVRPPSNSRGGRYTGTLYPKQLRTDNDSSALDLGDLSEKWRDRFTIGGPASADFAV